jgi:alpha-D-ribose 1-methylphosphonate 5-triphosphate synthase subunit PhnH
MNASALDAARDFRALLEAMARPGRVMDIAADRASPGPLSPAAAAALTHNDADAPIWLPEELRGGDLEAFLRFSCSATPAERPEDAAFALGRWRALASTLDRLPRGTAERPDRSATLIVEVDRLEAGRGVRLTGPGIDGETLLEAGLASDFWTARAADAFPLGLDALLCAGGRIAALPRTSRAEM